MRKTSFLAGFTLVSIFGYALASDWDNPQIASTSLSEICKPGYSREHRSNDYSLRQTVRQGRSFGQVDHIVPLCLGGADKRVNLQWQEATEAAEKDQLEVLTCRAVCAGHIPLSAAQEIFLTDWRKARDLFRQ